MWVSGTFRGFRCGWFWAKPSFSADVCPFRADSPEGGRSGWSACLNINRSAFGHVVAEGYGARVASLGCPPLARRPFREGAPRRRCMGFDLTAHRATNFTDFKYQPGDLCWRWKCATPTNSSVAAFLLTPSPVGALVAPHRIHIHDPHLHTDSISGPASRSSTRRGQSDRDGCARESPCLTR